MLSVFHRKLADIYLIQEVLYVNSELKLLRTPGYKYLDRGALPPGAYSLLNMT